MPVQPFASVDQGFLELLNSSRALTDAMYAVLITTTHTPNRATDTAYSNISGNESADADYDPVALAGQAISIQSTRIRFTCNKITLTAAGDITGRYLYLLFGTAATPNSADRVLGYIDLTGGGNASSVNAEFSFTPHANGLWEILRTAAP
jgi:hypothetical protein